MTNHVINVDQVEEWTLGKHEGVTSRLLIDGQNMTVLWSKWQPGAVAPEHIHPHEQVGICFSGEIIITINGRDLLVKEGEFYYIPGNVPHAERNDAEKPAVLTDFFSPIRSDLLNRKFDPDVLGKNPGVERNKKTIE